MVYDIEGNKDRYSRCHGFNFSISCSYNTNYNYLFQNTDSLYSKPKFKFALGSASYKL